MIDPPEPRPLEVRTEDAYQRLRTATQMWLATGGHGGPHLIPVAVIYDDGDLISATFEHSKTVTNLNAVPQARLALGTTADVVMVDASADLIAVQDMDSQLADRYAAISHDPRTMPGFIYLRFSPHRIQAWNGFHEFTGRTIMLQGTPLLEPVD